MPIRQNVGQIDEFPLIWLSGNICSNIKKSLYKLYYILYKGYFKEFQVNFKRFIN